MSGDGDAKQSILTQLAPQMASAVEWTTQIQTMYAAGARAFIEVGPKRALSMFATQILEDQPSLAIMTNHPNKVELHPFCRPRYDGSRRTSDNGQQEIHPVLTEAFRAGPIEAHRATSTIRL